MDTTACYTHPLPQIFRIVAAKKKDSSNARPPWAVRIQQARKDAGLTQKGLLLECGYAAKQNTRMANYESGQNEPSLKDFEKIAKATGHEPDFLAFGKRSLLKPEYELLRDYRLCDPNSQAVIRQAAATGAEAAKATKKSQGK